jgi:salicylate hydroxylase
LRVGPLYDRDPQIEIPPNYPIAIIGDASHPMTPFKGQGANTAMMDALELAELILRYQDNLQGLLGILPEFQNKSMNRASKFVMGSRNNTFFLHTPEALLNQ